MKKMMKGKMMKDEMGMAKSNFANPGGTNTGPERHKYPGKLPGDTMPVTKPHKGGSYSD